MIQSRMHIETKPIHAGDPKSFFDGAVTLPVFQSSTFQYNNEDHSGKLKYIRLIDDFKRALT